MTPEEYMKERDRQIRKNLMNRLLDTNNSLITEQLVKSNYVKNFTWWGIPIIQYPSDIMVIQELIWEIKPDFIIETGMAFGGSTLFYAAMLEMLGSGRVISIEIDPREENIARLADFALSNRILIAKGSSSDITVIEILKTLGIRETDQVLVILDSNHTHDHVLQELRLYSPFVSVGSYIIVMDTAIEFYGHLDKNQDRPWGKGNNPWTAVQQFLKETDDFIIDKEVEQRAYITSAPDGWLRRVK